jgi:AraC-like DNA-binding protein
MSAIEPMSEPTKFLRAVSWAGLDIDVVHRYPLATDPALSGWKWELGSDVSTFFHPGQRGSTHALTYQATRDFIGLRVSVSGASGISYSLRSNVIDLPPLDVMLVYLRRGETLETKGQFCGRTVGLLMDFSWLRRTLGKDDPVIRALVANDRGLLLRAPRISSAVPRLFGELAAASLSSQLTRQLLFRAKALELLAVSLELFTNSSALFGDDNPIQPHERELAEAAMRHIRAQIATEISTASLARKLGTNRTTLRDAFRRVTGRTMVHFRMECRMELAASLILSKHKSIANVAHEVGYADSASFCVAFRQYFGRTPGEARHCHTTVENDAESDDPNLRSLLPIGK